MIIDLEKYENFDEFSLGCSHATCWLYEICLAFTLMAVTHEPL
jgi:hypothetical protein